MPIHLRPRSDWAQHVAEDPRIPLLMVRLGKTAAGVEKYAETATANENSWEPWTGGVFIHHRGEGTFRPESEGDCQREIARAWASGFFDVDDIHYNFLVCPHGQIYEGRGYRRAEGNAPGYVNGVGRNTGFYSICGLLRSQDAPAKAMRDSIKNLIWHLRAEVSDSKRAGGLLLPHSLGYDTECPGNLTSYAEARSSMDPGMPVAGKEPAGLQIISRSQWGARPPRDEDRVTPSQRTGFAVHYSAGPTSQTPRAIQNYHMDGNGWWDIGYNFLVDRSGRIFEGRGWMTVGAHAKDYNTSHFGVCFIGRDGDATQAAKNSIRSLYFKANDYAGKTLTRTYHSAIGSTQCPGNDLRTWVRNGMPGTTYPIVGGSPVYNGEPPGDGSAGGLTDVRSIASQQRAVNGLGYTPPLDVDGLFGPLTNTGVKWLQTKVGVSADGLWGPLTEAAYVAYNGGGGSDGGLTTIRTAAAQQRAVNGLGYAPPLDVDGVFGPLTEAGVKWLQTKVGVGADGLWGPATEAAYVAHTGGSANADGGLTTIRSVTAQQYAVNGLGHTPKLDVDGLFGPRTEAGVKWLQTKVGVDPDGLWGPATEAAYDRYEGGAGLTVDGTFGPATVTALQYAIGASADGVWGPESKRALQQHLNTWADAGLIVDGDTGPATVKAMQRHLNTMTGAGLIVDGDWGTGTTKALQTALNQGRF
ncbi:peptidoglycan-binding protein [Streptomyces pristinaespiralis]|uniref:peptidoglycan-binding protein n=1 Tax=Streptomyces pristinaespiralis TaxID=38300 RepID=UPI0033DD6BDA